MSVSSVSGAGGSAASDYAAQLKAAIAARAQQGQATDGDGDHDGDKSADGVK